MLGAWILEIIDVLYTHAIEGEVKQHSHIQYDTVLRGLFKLDILVIYLFEYIYTGRTNYTRT